MQSGDLRTCYALEGSTASGQVQVWGNMLVHLGLGLGRIADGTCSVRTILVLETAGRAPCFRLPNRWCMVRWRMGEHVEDAAVLLWLGETGCSNDLMRKTSE